MNYHKIGLAVEVQNSLLWLRQRCWQSLFHKGSEKNLFSCLFFSSFWRLALIPWLVAPHHITFFHTDSDTALPSSFFDFLASHYKDTVVIFKAHIHNPGWCLHLKSLNTVAYIKIFYPYKVKFTGYGNKDVKTTEAVLYGLP